MFYLDSVDIHKPCLDKQWFGIILFVYLSIVLSMQTSDSTVGGPEDRWFQNCQMKREPNSNFI